MKMVSASKFTKVEKELQFAKAFGYGPRKFYVSSHLKTDALDDELPKKKDADTATPVKPEDKPKAVGDESKTKRIYIAMASDRGLCGGVHSGVARNIRRNMTSRSAVPETHKLVCVGDKSRSLLRSNYSKHFIMTAKQVGRVTPVFTDASRLALAIIESGYSYDQGEIYYNKYFSPIKYTMSIIPVFNKQIIEVAPNMLAFDDLEDDHLQSYAEWTLAALLYYTLKHGSASELSARVSAMDSAVKNAAEMLRKLSLLYNRTRQSVITRELIEIISGAAALK